MIALGIGQVAPREHRESYTDQVVASAVASANGTAASGLTAVVEAVAFWWERALSGGRSDALSPWMLGRIGRDLVLRGESLWWLSRGGLQPVSDHEVRGGSGDPRRWSYRLTLPSPDSTISRTVASDRVLHVRIGSPRNQPWRGCSPLVNAAATKAVLEQIERSLAEEHSGPVGNVIAVPDPEGSSAVATEIGSLKGRSILTEASEMDLPGEGQSARTQWRPNRIGPAPSTGTQAIRQDVELSIAGACGVPTELIRPAAGADPGQAFRRFVSSTIEPIAALLSAELRRLGLASEIDFGTLRAADLQVRSRAYAALRKTDFPEADARRLCGLV